MREHLDKKQEDLGHVTDHDEELAASASKTRTNGVWDGLAEI